MKIWDGMNLQLECSGSDGRALGLQVRDSPPVESLSCVLGQDTFLYLALVQPRKTCLDLTEKLLTGTLCIKTKLIHNLIRVSAFVSFDWPKNMLK